MDVSQSTFERLDLLLRSVCENLDAGQGAYRPLHQDQECMVVAALNLLKLQVCMDVCRSLPSNQCFYRKIADYWMSVGHHRGRLMMTGSWSWANKIVTEPLIGVHSTN